MTSHKDEHAPAQWPTPATTGEAVFDEVHPDHDYTGTRTRTEQGTTAVTASKSGRTAAMLAAAEALGLPVHLSEMPTASPSEAIRLQDRARNALDHPGPPYVPSHLSVLCGDPSAAYLHALNSGGPVLLLDFETTPRMSEPPGGQQEWALGADKPTAAWLRKHGLVGLADQRESEPVLFSAIGLPAITDEVAEH